MNEDGEGSGEEREVGGEERDGDWKLGMDVVRVISISRFRVRCDEDRAYVGGEYWGGGLKGTGSCVA